MSTPPQCPPCNATSQPQEWDAEVNGLNTALMILRGEGDGISDEQKQQSVDVLQRLLTSRIHSPSS